MESRCLSYWLRTIFATWITTFTVEPSRNPGTYAEPNLEGTMSRDSGACVEVKYESTTNVRGLP